MSMIIGINGEIASGKTTVSEYLVNKYNMLNYSFAQPLKDVAVTLGFEHHQVFGTQEEKLQTNQFWGISGRKFLQIFGSEVCRDYVPQVLPDMQFNGTTMWVRLFEKFHMDHPDMTIVVNDVRFADESSKIKELGGYVIRLVRPKADSDMNVDEYDANQHQSELQASEIKPNIIIRNDGTLEQLYNRVETAIRYIQMGMLKDPSTVIYL